MADTIELFLVGQGLLLITFITMVGLFLLLLFVRVHFGSGISESLTVQCDDMTGERRETRGWFSTGPSRSSAAPVGLSSEARNRGGWFRN